MGEHIIDLVLGEPARIVREGLLLLIGRRPGIRVVGHAGDTEAVLSIARKVRPDVLVLASALATERTLERLAAAGLCGRVVVLGDADSARRARATLKAGAAAFVRKHSGPDELFDAIQAVASGKRYLDPALGAAVIQRRFEETALGDLTPRQRDVLRLLVMGYTNREVAARLGVSERTVEGHRAQVFDRLGLAGRAELVRYAHEHGLTEPPAETAHRPVRGS